MRPLRRRAATIARPARVRIRTRNPWVLARWRLLGWNVRLLTVVSRPVEVGISRCAGGSGRWAAVGRPLSEAHGVTGRMGMRKRPRHEQGRVPRYGSPGTGVKPASGPGGGGRTMSPVGRQDRATRRGVGEFPAQAGRIGPSRVARARAVLLASPLTSPAHAAWFAVCGATYRPFSTGCGQRCGRRTGPGHQGASGRRRAAVEATRCR